MGTEAVVWTGSQEDSLVKASTCFRPGPFLSREQSRVGCREEARQKGGLGRRGGGLGAPMTPLSPTCSIHNGVIAVFQRKGLPDQELFSLNEGVR